MALHYSIIIQSKMCVIIQWNLCNLTPEFSDILWHPTKIYSPTVFLLTKIKPEYSDILYNPTHFPGPLMWQIWQVPQYNLKCVFKYILGVIIIKSETFDSFHLLLIFFLNQSIFYINSTTTMSYIFFTRFTIEMKSCRSLEKALYITWSQWPINNMFNMLTNKQTKNKCSQHIWCKFTFNDTFYCTNSRVK